MIKAADVHILKPNLTKFKTKILVALQRKIKFKFLPLQKKIKSNLTIFHALTDLNQRKAISRLFSYLSYFHFDRFQIHYLILNSIIYFRMMKSLKK